MGAGTGRARPPAPQDHRPVRAGGPADGRRRARGHRRLQRLHLQLPRAARASSRRQGYRFFSTGDTEVIAQGLRTLGRRASSSTSSACSPSPSSSATTGGCCSARDRLGIKPLYLAEVAGKLRFASTLPALLAGGGVDTSIDPVALHHYLTFHAVVPAPRTILRGVRKLPPATCWSSSPTARATSHLLAHRLRPPTRARGLVGPRLGGGRAVALRTAVDRRMVADVPVGVPALGRARLQPDRRAAGRGRPARPARPSASASSRTAARATSSATPTSSPSGSPPTTTASASATTGCCRLLGGAIAAMSEPMVSHDGVAFYLLSRRCAKHVKVVQSGQGADEVFAGYHWYPPMLERAAADGASTPTPRRSSTAPRRGDGEVVAGRLPRPTTTGRRVRRRALRPPGRRDAASTGRCGSTPRSCSSTTR